MTAYEGHWDGTDPEEYLAEHGDGLQDVAVPEQVWEVLVERNDEGRWGLYVPDQPVEFSSLPEAQAAAEELASSFSPDDPFSPRYRTIYRTGDGRYLVALEGARETFHFTVQVAERMAVVEY
ncbi:hypothetical protein OG474_06640 [Kribbella sp. NBC_01505]|uniref:hypothetical protein n=1 Tax=Kribbella sp. NBC_01505 TaxID=2903580 RepID=UPI0038677C80